jgi:pyruvate/2-oxoglutarate/acetoin dehydrogenase E1 component
MAASIGQNVQYVGTEASPIALSIQGGATDVWTWAHNQGRKASVVEVLDAASRQPIASSTIAPGVTAVGKIVIVTQPDVNTIKIENQSTVLQNAILRVTWSDESSALGAPLAATVGTLSTT